MSGPEAPRGFIEANDSDLLAVRNLMQTDDPVPSNGPVNKDNAALTASPEAAPARAALAETGGLESGAETEPKSLPSKPTSPSAASQFAAKTGHWAWGKIKTYRPDRKAILFTSFVLLLVLKPFMILGWSLFAGFVVLLCYLFMGSDRFWRTIISMFQAFKRRRPAAARILKLRSYVIARKWNGLLHWAPQGISDFFQAPDLREIIAADSRHEAAMSDRLSRMRGDPAAG